MPAVVLEDIQLAWEYGHGFAHACSYFKNQDRGHRSTYARRLRDLADQLEKGTLSDEVAAHRVAAATAAFVHNLAQEAVTLTVTASVVEEEEPDQAADA